MLLGCIVRILLYHWVEELGFFPSILCSMNMALSVRLALKQCRNRILVCLFFLLFHTTHQSHECNEVFCSYQVRWVGIYKLLA